MSNLKRNTIIASVGIVTFFLLKRKQAHAAEREVEAQSMVPTPKVGDQAVLLEEDDIGNRFIREHTSIPGERTTLDQSKSIYIKFPGYQVYYPQLITGAGQISQEDGDIILQHF